MADEGVNYILGGGESRSERACRSECFDIDRPKLYRYLRFATGLHACLAHLAKEEARIEDAAAWNLADQLQQPAQVTHALAA
jgi:cytochrome P450